MKRQTIIALLLCVAGCADSLRIEPVELSVDEQRAVVEAIHNFGETNQVAIVHAEKWTKGSDVSYRVVTHIVDQPNSAQGPMYELVRTKNEWSVRTAWVRVTL
jgi:hypothetical protein